MLDKVHIFDGVVPECFVTEIENLLLDGSFPWLFVRDITHSTQQKVEQGLPDSNYGFGHLLYSPKEMSPFFETIKPLTYFGSATKLFGPVFGIHRARAFLQLPSPNPVVKPNHAHTDLKFPHIVMLYYVCDSDGDTVLYDRENSGVVSGTITPKRGRFALFDGTIYHASTPPTSTPRAVINFDLAPE